MPVAGRDRPCSRGRLALVDLATSVGRMSYTEYLAFESTADTKHEYVNGEVYAMAGGSPEHARLQSRLSRLLGNALEGRPCEVFGSDLRVRIEATGRATYPDLTVVCGRLETATDDPDAVTNPTVLVEVLSESTERDGRGSQWAHYQRLASLKEYVLVSQDERRVEIYRRAGERWTYESVVAGRVRLEALDIALDVEKVYENTLAGGLDPQ